MRKKLSIFLTAFFLFGSLLSIPKSVAGHHGGSFWFTHNTYYTCTVDGFYRVEQQHRHLADGSWDYRDLRTHLGANCPVQ